MSMARRWKRLRRQPGSVPWNLQTVLFPVSATYGRGSTYPMTISSARQRKGTGGLLKISGKKLKGTWGRKEAIFTSANMKTGTAHHARHSSPKPASGTAGVLTAKGLLKGLKKRATFSACQGIRVCSSNI